MKPLADMTDDELDTLAWNQELAWMGRAAVACLCATIFVAMLAGYLSVKLWGVQ